MTVGTFRAFSVGPVGQKAIRKPSDPIGCGGGFTMGLRLYLSENPDGLGKKEVVG